MSQVKSQSNEFPKAIFAQSFGDAAKILDRVPQFRSIVEDSISQAGCENTHWRMIKCAAAEMWENGMLHEAFEASCESRANAIQADSITGISQPASERIIRREQVKALKQQRSKIVGNLQSVGILPAGFAWFLMQWVVLPVLMEILKRWCLNWYFDEVQAAGK